MRSSHQAVLTVVLFLAAATVGVAEEASQNVVAVSFRLDDGRDVSPTKMSGRLRFQPLLGGAVRDLAISGNAPAAIELPARSSWEVITEIDGHWAPRRVISIADAERVVKSWRVWSTGTLAGRVNWPAGEPRLPSLSVSLTAPPDPRPGAKLPAGLIECPIDEKNQWRCEVPAGQLDVSFRAPGFVPHYRWGVRLATGKSLDVGTLTLEKGASLVGWVEVEDGELDPKRAAAKLLPLAAPGSGGQTSQRLEKALHQARVEESGFFQLTGVKPGSFILEVSQPGFAPTRLFPLELWTGQESRIEDALTLRPAMTVEVVVLPPQDWKGRPWAVQVYRHADYSASLDHQPAYQGSADGEGRVLVPDQAPGQFWFLIGDEDGNTVASEWHVPITGPEKARYEIAVEAVTVAGTLSLADEPLAGTVIFGGRHGDVSVAMDADEDGIFTGTVPRDGDWHVEVEAQQPVLRERAFLTLRANKKGEAETEISLPDTEVFGRVVDGDGQPVADVSVRLDPDPPQLSRFRRTKEDGSFRFIASPRGQATLTASQGGAVKTKTARPASVTVVEGSPVGPVEIRLEDTKAFRGRVVSPTGGVAGAVVQLAPRPGWHHPTQETTDIRGELVASLPAEAESVEAVISAPGHALQGMRAALDERTLLPVTQHGGTIEIVLPPKSRRLALYQDGIRLPFSTLMNWAWSHGGTVSDTLLSVPKVAPGEYRFCEVDPNALLGTIPPGPCSDTYLGVGQTARVEPPEPAN